MSNKFNPFNNPKPAIYFIFAFVALIVLFLAIDAKAETEVEYGATFLSADYSDGAAMFFSEIWADKYLVGFGIIGDQVGKFSEGELPVESNMLIQAQRLVSYKGVELGIGVATWQHTNRALGDEFTFSLSAGYSFGNWHVRYRHYSNGGTARPNTGQDLLLIGYRFK